VPGTTAACLTCRDGSTAAHGRTQTQRKSEQARIRGACGTQMEMATASTLLPSINGRRTGVSNDGNSTATLGKLSGNGNLTRTLLELASVSTTTLYDRI
jgi:hypothetical protein